MFDHLPHSFAVLHEYDRGIAEDVFDTDDRDAGESLGVLLHGVVADEELERRGPDDQTVDALGGNEVIRGVRLAYHRVRFAELATDEGDEVAAELGGSVDRA